MIYAKGGGRFGNEFFRNMYTFFLSEKLNYGRQFQNPALLKKIGIQVEDRIRPKQKETVIMNENDLLYFLSLEKYTKNINLENIFCQTEEFARYLIEYFPFYEDVWNFNPFKERYGKNDDVFVHYRIGDLEKLGIVNPLEYYEQVLDSLLPNERKGYIASDSPNHPNVKKLREKYQLEVVNKDMYETILFGSTCKHIVLSLGTFSWITGFLSQRESQVYYLHPQQVKYWHGKIFQAFSDSLRWNRIELEGVEKKEHPSVMHKNNYTFPLDKVFFMHLPKTGGTSISSMKIPQVVCYLHHPVSYNCPPENGYQYFTVMRNPIDRVWSLYHQHKKIRKTSNFPSFIEKCWEAQNAMVRYLAGYSDNVLISEEELLDRAKARLKQFFFVIDFDHFSEDVRKMMKKLEGEEVPIPHMRVNKYNKSIALEFRTKIIQHNQLDIQLYKHFIQHKEDYQKF